MGSVKLKNGSIVHNKYAIAVHNSAQSVSNGKNSFVFELIFKQRLNDIITVCVHT